jgi:transposase
MGSTRRSFTDEYKRQAVELVIDGNRSIVEVARNIGAHESTIGQWVKKAKESRQGMQDLSTPLTESERAFLVRLKSESLEDKAKIADLQMQVEFAKKVASWFAKDQR